MIGVNLSVVTERPAFVPSCSTAQGLVTEPQAVHRTSLEVKTQISATASSVKQITLTIFTTIGVEAVAARIALSQVSKTKGFVLLTKLAFNATLSTLFRTQLRNLTCA